MGPIRRVFGGLPVSNAGDRTGWLRMQSAANSSPQFKFPANRENNREFCRIWRSTVILASDQRADSIAYSGIPCATEQRISKRVSGKIFQGTGNRYAISGAAARGPKPALSNMRGPRSGPARVQPLRGRLELCIPGLYGSTWPARVIGKAHQ